MGDPAFLGLRMEGNPTGPVPIKSVRQCPSLTGQADTKGHLLSVRSNDIGIATVIRLGLTESYILTVMCQEMGW